MFILIIIKERNEKKKRKWRRNGNRPYESRRWTIRKDNNLRQEEKNALIKNVFKHF